jgi:aryl-alcohol dehydrogenase-like predicted oxidoreductase
VEALAGWADGQGVTLLDVAVGGLAAIPGCASVIAGAMTAEQVKANAAAGDWVPSAGQLAEINQIVPSPAAQG